MSQVKELRVLTDQELRQRLDQTHQDLRGLRLKASGGAVEQPHRIRQMRRDIARMLTILGELRRSEGHQGRAECRKRQGSGRSEGHQGRAEWPDAHRARHSVPPRRRRLHRKRQGSGRSGAPQESTTAS